MPKFTTEIKAIDPLDGELKTYSGQHVEAPSWGLAEQWCRENAGYLKVNGELVAEVDHRTGKVTNFDFYKN